VADVADKISVMYAGRLIEQAPIIPLYGNPAHPYTERLLAAIPRVDLKGQELYTIKGIPPNLTDIPAGCAFHPRCPYTQPICSEQVPPLVDVSDGRRSACHFWKEVLDGSLQIR
jgi:oligopeptide/dipeptide ABC transporter ATP-binding protein